MNPLAPERRERPHAEERMSVRTSRELRSTAKALDLTAQGITDRAADALSQRYKALDMSLADRNWSQAQHIELIPAEQAVLTDHDELMATKEQSADLKMTDDGAAGMETEPKRRWSRRRERQEQGKRKGEKRQQAKETSLPQPEEREQAVAKTATAKPKPQEVRRRRDRLYQGLEKDSKEEHNHELFLLRQWNIRRSNRSRMRLGRSSPIEPNDAQCSIGTDGTEGRPSLAGCEGSSITWRVGRTGERCVPSWCCLWRFGQALDSRYGRPSDCFG